MCCKWNCERVSESFYLSIKHFSSFGNQKIISCRQLGRDSVTPGSDSVENNKIDFEYDLNKIDANDGERLSGKE